MFRSPSFRLASVLLAAIVTFGVERPADGQNTQSSSLAELFQKGKTQFKIASYQSSLATFERLDELSQQSGYEKDRAELVPVVAFYRGANLAALGQAEAAIREFEKYLASSPNTRLDPSLYPKPVIEALNRARDERRRTPSRTSGYNDRGLAAEYASFRPPEGKPTIPVDEKWGSSPVRYLMTEAEKLAWERTTSPVERAAFVTSFWQKRDLNPSTPENEFRQEFEKRVFFADARFHGGEKKGSETDRGLVFILLGPPSYGRLYALAPEDDLNLSVRKAPRSEAVLNPDGSIRMRTVGPEGLGAQPGGGQREVWYYKRDRLPASVKQAEVAFEFLTKQSYGVAVLQREPVVLKTLEQASRDTLTSPN